MLGEIARSGLTALVLIAAVIGVLFVTRGTAVRRVRGVGVDGVPVGVSEPDFAATVALLAGGRECECTSTNLQRCTPRPLSWTGAGPR